MSGTRVITKTQARDIFMGIEAAFGIFVQIEEKTTPTIEIPQITPNMLHPQGPLKGTKQRVV